MTLKLTKYDAYIFRRYITDLEFKSAEYELGKQKITLLESKNVLWEQRATNYQQQLASCNYTLDEQVVLQTARNEQLKRDIKKSHRKGIKKGAILGAAAIMILCLLVK